MLPEGRAFEMLMQKPFPNLHAEPCRRVSDKTEKSFIKKKKKKNGQAILTNHVSRGAAVSASTLRREATPHRPVADVAGRCGQRHCRRRPSPRTYDSHTDASSDRKLAQKFMDCTLSIGIS